MKHIRQIILLTLYIFILSITLVNSLIIKDYHQTILFILLINIPVLLMLFLILYKLFNPHPFLIKLLILIYQIISTIQILYAFITLVGKFYYIKTPVIPILIIVYLTLIIINKLDFEKIFDLIFLLSLFALGIQIIAFFLYPNLNIKPTLSYNNKALFLSILYFPLIFDVFLMFITAKKTSLNILPKDIFISITIACLLSIIYTFIDLSISNINFFYDLFPNLIKYRITEGNLRIHLDLLTLLYLFIMLLYRISFYESFNKLTFKKYNPNFLISLSFIFLLFITIIFKSQVQCLTTLLIIQTLTCLILILGGLIYRKTSFKKLKKRSYLFLL